MSLTWHVIDACQSCDVTQTLADWEARSCCLANAWDNWHGAHPLNRHPVMVGCNNRLAGFSSFSYKFKTHRSNGSINHCETPSFLDSQPFWPLRTSGSWTPTLHVRLGHQNRCNTGNVVFFPGRGPVVVVVGCGGGVVVVAVAVGVGVGVARGFDVLFVCLIVCRFLFVVFRYHGYARSGRCCLSTDREAHLSRRLQRKTFSREPTDQLVIN